jgi:hypothetical protein
MDSADRDRPGRGVTLTARAADVCERAADVEAAAHAADHDRIMRALWRLDQSIASMRAATVAARNASDAA